MAAATLVVSPPLMPGMRETLPALPLCGSRFLRKVDFKPDNTPIRPALNLLALAPFVDALPIPQIAHSTEKRNVGGEGGKLPYYRFSMRQIESQVHRDMQPTRFWSYGSGIPGPTIQARSGQGILVEFSNELPQKHFLPIDYRLHGAGPDQPEVRTVAHLHGGRTPADSDGYPEHWITPGQTMLHHFPNRQEAATLWYHDHAMGINRLNMYAGLFGTYIIGDEFEDHLVLPRDEFDIPLLLSDRLFYRDDHQLYYPVSSFQGAPWVSDIHATGTLINGKLYPYLEVQPRKYRFRVVCAANSRSYRLSLAAGSLPFVQIASDQGLLAAPLTRTRLTLAPAERADLVIDFSTLAGQRVALMNDALEVLQFRVGADKANDPSRVPPTLRPVPRLAAASAVKTRRMTLTEHDDRAGEALSLTLNEMPWSAPVTETPRLDSVEIWEFLNLTDDVHPIHLHLVRFQLLNRQGFHAADFVREGKVVFTTQPSPPPPGEDGWKDTIQAYPGVVTRIIVRFEGYVGRYLWHCHILEHEANDMMRPFEVLPAPRHSA